MPGLQAEDERVSAQRVGECAECGEPVVGLNCGPFHLIQCSGCEKSAVMTVVSDADDAMQARSLAEQLSGLADGYESEHGTEERATVADEDEYAPGRVN